MSSVTYGNGIMSSNDDMTIPSILPSSSGAIIQHPYLASNANAAYAAVAAVAASPSSLGSYSNYYGHQLPQQPLIHVQQPTSFYPTAAVTTTTTLNHLQHQGDFSNSSSSAASSSSSIESSRKTANRKRPTEKTTTSTKSNNKRKAPNHDDDDIDDDDDDEENMCHLRGTSLSNVMMSNHHNNNNPNNGTMGEEDKEKQARENHCEIERRRRVKMATYFAELCDMVPACSNLARKPDKLTILRMAAQFMKNLRTNNNSLAINVNQQQDLHKPSFLNDHELKYLMAESCDAFLFALNCETLRIIYVSDAIQHILSYTCHDWYSRFFYDFVHPDDVEKVREQLNLQPQDGSPCTNGNARILDLKTGTVKKDGHSTGARLVSSKRSFICRLRVGSISPLEHTHPNTFISPSVLRRRHRMSLGPSIDGNLYEVVHVSGYIRNLNTHLSSSHHDNSNHHPSSSTNSNGQMAFIAIARIQNSSTPNVNDLTNGSISTYNSITTEFTCRCHWDTGEILFIDQRCTPIIGYKSHELLHKTIYEQIHPEDHMKFQDLFKRTVTQKNIQNTSTNMIIRFRTNIDNEYISLKTSTYAFCNPCTDDIEFIIITFLSMQSPTANKTSVITNSNDYNRQTYDTSYTRATAAAAVAAANNQNSNVHYPSQSPATYNNQEGQDYSNTNGTNDERTYVSNNAGSAWASANDNWTTSATASTATSVNNPTNNSEYVDAQANITLYHQYH